MLTLRDIPEPLVKKLKDEIIECFKNRDRVWKNHDLTIPFEREEMYRQAFQDGIRASLNILPIKF